VLRSPIIARAALLTAPLLIAVGCGRRTPAHVQTPKPVQPGWTETGIASWYGLPFDGRRASSGEIFDMHALTAAHRTLPFDTWVEVQDLDNGKKINVRINDRGPFVNGRIIDLSFAAADSIEMVRPGIARVRIRVIPAVKDTLGYTVQAGAFSDRARADALCASLSFPDVRVAGGPLWRVLVGTSLSREAAERLAAQIRKTTGQALVVREDGRDN
jgi:rare lipoprotein A